MAKRDPERTRKIRIAVRYLMERDCLGNGNQSRLAEHFQVSRQRVHQIVVEERRRLLASASTAYPSHISDSSVETLARGSLSRPVAGA